MNAPAVVVAATVHTAEQPSDLRAIAAPGTAAVLWRRAADPRRDAWLDGLPHDRLPALRATLAVEAVEKAVEKACSAADTDDAEPVGRLAADVAALARACAEAAGVGIVRLRLDPVDTDSCRRFHIDHVRFRLLCTYRGIGTEFGIGSGDAGPRHVERTRRGDVLLLRGRRWPGEPTALVHRSPPIADTGETRLLLVIDPDDPEID